MRKEKPKAIMFFRPVDIYARQKEIESWYKEPVEARFVSNRHFRGWQVWLGDELIDEWDGE